MIAKTEFVEWFLQQAGNHLWQSTAFAAAAFLVAAALRSTHARARHWVWLAASLKFLVPFGVLASLGGVIGSWVVPAAPSARVPFTVAQVVQPFALPPQQAAPAVAAPAAGPAAFPVAAVLLSVWLIGFAAVLFHWWNRWRRVRAAVRDSARVREGREADALRRLRSNVELVSSAARLEPGTFGILRPVLWLPAGIADRLSEAELDAILVHELCHARHRDNLWAAVHMAVEATFWFHPLVWWLGARLVEERERACDEEVVRLGSEPQAYAEGVLKVCEFYLESPLACVAGVTGADLRTRIEGIMESRFMAELCFWKKLLLTSLLAAVVACPLLLGVFKAEAQTAEPQRSGPSRPAVGEKSPRFTFEVASVKPAPERDYGTWSRPTGMAPEIQGDPAQIVFDDVSLIGVICRAYGVRPLDIKVPGWMQDLRYDIHAKVPADAPKGHIPEMLQNLLADRFQMKLHWETREEPGYILTVAKGGPKLKQSAPDDPRRRPTPGASFSSKGHFELRRITMSRFANALRGNMDRPVIDKTELQGEYDIVYDAAPDSMPGFFKGFGAGQQNSEFPTIFAALRQLGLNLAPEKKVGVKYLVVDSALKVPTEN